MRTTYLILCYFVFMTGLNSQSDLSLSYSSVENIFLKADKLYNEIQNMAYFYRMSGQFGIEADTFQLYGNGYIQKTTDELLGCKFHITNIKTKEKGIYNGEKFAQINDKNKTVRISSIDESGFYNIHLYADKIPTAFVKNYFTKLKADTTVSSIKLVSDTIIDKTLCYQVRIIYDTFNKFVSKGVNYFFQKDNFFCKGKQGFGSYAGYPRYDDYIIVFADVNIDLDEDLFKPYKNIPATYKKLKNQTRRKTRELLDYNKKVPKFRAYTLNNVKITRDDLINQITILDFWYIGCGPCLATVPVLDRIALNYKDRGIVVLGMNPFNDKNEIQRFKKFSNLSYKSLMIDHGMIEKFKVQGYPTIYILNQEGKVVYSRIGGMDNLYEELSKTLDNLLSQ